MRSEKPAKKKEDKYIKYIPDEEWKIVIKEAEEE